jgi:hypothetical protein
MTTARDVIANMLRCGFDGKGLVSFEAGADAIVTALLSAPESVRLELAALLNPWREIETAPKDEDTTLHLGCFSEEGAGMQFIGYYQEGAPNCGPDHVWHVEDASIVYHRNLPTHFKLLPVTPLEEKT